MPGADWTAWLPPDRPGEAAAGEVLARHYSLSGIPLTNLGNHGGFSGARLWRVESAAALLCLRAWPPGDPTPARLGIIHEWMRSARDAGLSFVPAVLPTVGAATWVEHLGRLWELTTWMPGRADFRERPSRARLEVACTALAQLHTVWGRKPSPPAPCPAVLRRLARAREWLALLQSGWQPSFGPEGDDPVVPWARRAWSVLLTRIAEVPGRLAAWHGRVMPLQPCLCDVWHDHVLYEGNLVVGVIDFGAAKVDHVAVDLARLLGSFAGGDAALWSAGIQAYARWRPLAAEEEALAAVLDETGLVVGLATWLRWLYSEGRTFADRMAVAGRLADLVARAASCGSAG
jgi:Ser/Thr protein kinase RdoA (MazF antagonist)